MKGRQRFEAISRKARSEEVMYDHQPTTTGVGAHGVSWRERAQRGGATRGFARVCAGIAQARLAAG
jgi:hypothetical protein